MQRDESTLLDIAKAARAVQSFIQELDKASFLKDYKTQSAVLYQIVVMGEAVKRLFLRHLHRSCSPAIIPLMTTTLTPNTKQPRFALYMQDKHPLSHDATFFLVNVVCGLIVYCYQPKKPSLHPTESPALLLA